MVSKKAYTPSQKEIPPRGLSNLQEAKEFSQHFPITDRLILPTETNAYLIQKGLLAPDASRAERNRVRSEFLRRVRRASNTPLMVQEGLTPFEISIVNGGWRVESIEDAIRRRTPARKLYTQAITSKRKQRHLIETIDPVRAPLGYAVGKLVYHMTTVGEKVMKTMDDALAVACRELETSFRDLESGHGTVLPLR